MATKTASQVVRSFVLRRPKSGATRADIVRGTGLPENTVNPRVREWIETGDIYEGGKREGRAVLFPVLSGARS